MLRLLRVSVFRQMPTPRVRFVGRCGWGWRLGFSGGQLRPGQPLSQRVARIGVLDDACQGLSGVFDVLPGDEVALFPIGVTGDGIAALGRLNLEIQFSGHDLWSAYICVGPCGSKPVSECRCGVGQHGRAGGDRFSGGHRRYLIADASWAPSAVGRETFYTTAEIDPLPPAAVRSAWASPWALTVPADSMSSVLIDSIGSQVVAVDSNRVQINDLPVFVVETTPAEGLSGVFDVLPGDEVALFSIGVTGDRIAALGQLDLEISSLVDTTFGQPISASDLAGLNLYRSADAAWDSTDVLVDRFRGGHRRYLIADAAGLRGAVGRGDLSIATAEIDSFAAGGGAFRLGFPAGALRCWPIA